MPVVKDLGVLLDTRLSYNQHITETASKCLFKLYQINRIKHLLDRKTLLLAINSFVFSKLQYCSTVRNTSSSNIDKLQKVQNFAGRIIRDFKIGHYGRLGRLDAYTGGLGP